ncbi:MAG: extracellular solute-binding protein [Oscillospiraceae bacterium]|nr:extracellular solute-binding protein [Oscillospiraceae bacterium]
MRKILLLLLAAVLLLSGCGMDGNDYSALAPADDARLIIYTSHKENVYAPIIREFERRTGIWTELKTGGTNELLEEISAGNTDCDLMFGGGVDSLTAFADCFTKYNSPAMAQVDDKFKGDGTWTPFSSLPLVLIYNTQLVRVNPPTGWQSLLDSEWRGMIAFADPTVSGSSYTALCTMAQALGGDAQEVIRHFAENLAGRQTEGSGLVVSAVAEGSCYIGVTLEETALKAVSAGYDIALAYPEEGTSALPDGAAIVKGCAHEENARLFIDFLLSADVQERLPEKFSRRSVLKDAESDAELALLDYDLTWASGMQSRLLESWQGYFEGECK